MDKRVELRGGLIPSGNCVPDGDNTAVSTTFAEIDAGRSDERLLVLAQNACQMCVQINHCTVQTDHIATELWQRGAGIVIAGGTKVTLSHKERPVDEDRPILRFNLSAIPEDPADAVAIIRQAFRAGQFNATGPTPKGVRQAQQAYLGRLEQTDAGLHTRLSTMEKSELDSCMKFVLTALFQQKDFVNYAAGQDHYVGAARESTRYHSKYINPEKDDPIIGIFLQDALAIRDMQLSQIASKAAHFEPGYYAELIKKYKTDDITLKEFDTKVIHARINPVQAIVKHQATVGRIHGEQPDISPAAAREAARRGSKTLLSKEKLQTLIETYRSDSISAQQVIQFVHKNPGSPEAALDGLTARVEHLKTLYPAGHPTVRDVEIVAFAQGYRTLEGCQAAAQQFDNNMQALTAEYGDDPDITPSDIRKYSGMQDGHNAIATFKERISMLRETVGEDVSDSVIRQCARSGVTSPLEVQSKYTQTVLRDRYAYRARTKPEYKPLSSELIERIVTLYPRSETDQVAQTIFELIKRDHLVLGRAETYAQHGQLPEVFDKIFTPKTQEYLTFSGALGQLLPIQRLAFAHHHGLMPILYGTASSSVLFEQSALDGATINDYYTTHVEPQLAAYEASNTPMSLSLLAMDSAEYERLLRQDNRLLINDADRLTAYGLRDATLVVAGKALYLHEDTYRWDWAEHATDFDAWLTQKISTTYPPAHQKRAWTYIQEAIHGGVLDLLGSHPGEYQLVFNKQFYGPDVTEVQRTVVANAMGIDRLMYGSDLTNALRYRLGDVPQLVTIRRRSSQPTIVELPAEQLQAARNTLEHRTSRGHQSSSALSSVTHTSVRPALIPTTPGTESDELNNLDEQSSATSFEDYYENQVARYPLLTAEEEVTLAKAIEAGLLAAEALQQGGFRNATKHELEEIVRIGDEAKERMFLSNTRLVIKFAGKLIPTIGMSRLDYIQEGNIGLMRAIEMFDYTKGYKLSTYAVRWIKQHANKAKHYHSRTIRLPVHASEAVRAAKTYTRQYEQEHGVEPTTQQIAQELSMTESSLRLAIEGSRNQPLSLHYKISDEDNGAEFGDFIMDEAASPTDEVAMLNISGGLGGILERVMERYMTSDYDMERAAQVITLRYGLELSPAFFNEELVKQWHLEAGKRYTLQEIGAMYDCSYEAVRRWERNGLKALRQPHVMAAIKRELDG